MSSFESYFYRNIARKVKFYREKHGLTQEKLSEILGLNLKYIGHIERCERFVSNRTLIKLMELWKIPPKEFYDFDEEYLWFDNQDYSLSKTTKTIS